MTMFFVVCMWYGRVKGLEELLLGRQPSMSVVSDGAECVLLDKQFYLQHATETLLHRLRITEVS